MAITRSRQNWEAGSIVKVGFMKVAVLAVVPSPGDYLPDQYLCRSEKGQPYCFVPHNGLHKITDAEEAQMREGRPLEI